MYIHNKKICIHKYILNTFIDMYTQINMCMYLYIYMYIYIYIWWSCIHNSTVWSVDARKGVTPKF